MQALVYKDLSSPIAVEQVPIPEAEPGSAILKIFGATISPNMRKFFTGAWGGDTLIPPAPFTLGAPAIGRIDALGPDATSLAVGQLVFADFSISARDSDKNQITHGYIRMPSAANDKLAMAWKHGALAEYARVPMENLYLLDEDLLLNKLGYSIPDLLQFADCVIATAGLVDACELKAGDTLIVAPSTGRFGGCIVQVALAMGANVVAAGRTQSKLDALSRIFDHTGRLSTVVLTGDEDKDTAALRAAAGGEGADAFADMSPSMAKVTHIGSCIKALCNGGRATFLGGDVGMVEVPYIYMMNQNIRVQGSYMFGRKHVQQTLKLVEKGQLKLGSKLSSDFRVQYGFKLTELERVYAANEENLGFGNFVVVEP